MLNPFGFYQLNMPVTTISQDVTTAKKGPSTSLKMRLAFLEANLAKALLINEALWELMRDKLNITEQQFNEKLYEIDMRDGVLDGKNQRSVVECPKCHRKVSPRHPACLYCGQVLDESVFQMSG